MPLLHPHRFTSSFLAFNYSSSSSPHLLIRSYQISQVAGACKIRQLSSRRSLYGHISDHKMAPQLEPFFKQYVNL
ncbi:hypothetical protein BJX61DRAFT_503871, partial [Aspergillus egyptiacus]